MAKRYASSKMCFDCNAERMERHRNKTRQWPAKELLSSNRIARATDVALGDRFYVAVTACNRGHVGLRYSSSAACKTCQEEKSKASYAMNPAKINLERKARREADIEKSRARDRAYRLANLEKVSRSHVELRRKLRLSSPLYALKHNIRSLISASIKGAGFSKKSKTAKILCCNFDEFKLHIERQFLPDMGWHNRGLWQIDHITPMASARTEDDAIALNRFTNLRPIWAADNREKSDKIIFLI